MSWNIVEFKMKYIQRTLNPWELKTLERQFSETLNRFTRRFSSASSIRGVLFADLAYALVRHADWFQTPVFSALLVEFLQCDHTLSRSDAELLVHQLIETGIELGMGKARSICNDDREFLTWAYVCAAAAEGEESLEAELGLGTAVLNKLRDGLSALESVHSQAFVAEYDAMLASIIIELGHETKTIPWSMDLHRLKFALLAASADQSQPYILEEQLPIILSALVQIGLGNKNLLQDRPTLIEALTKADLVSLCESNSKKPSGIHLTDFGFRLTAHMFEAEHFSGWDAAIFCKLNHRWQLAIIRKSSCMSVSDLEAVLEQKLNHIAPEVIEVMICRLVQLGAHSLRGDALRSLLKNSKFAWHKSAILRAIRDAKPNQELLSIVADELLSDASSGVRLAASSLLDAWTDQGSLA